MLVISVVVFVALSHVIVRCARCGPHVIDPVPCFDLPYVYKRVYMFRSQGARYKFISRAYKRVYKTSTDSGLSEKMARSMARHAHSEAGSQLGEGWTIE